MSEYKKTALMIPSGLCHTNQYKDVDAQREFSASEARQRVKSIVILRLSSLTLHRMR